jgi:radical SAM protein with 4Fe4S-binding SPASM domain
MTVDNALHMVFRQDNIDNITRGFWLADEAEATNTEPDPKRSSIVGRWRDEQWAAYLVKRRRPLPEGEHDPDAIEWYAKITRIWKKWQDMQGDNPPLERYTAGLRRDFDINLDGVAHFGLLPDFLQDMRNQGLAVEDYFNLHPIYYQLRAELEKIVSARGLEAKETIRRTPMHINAGNGFVFISRRGEVFPSGFMPLSAGNVRQKSLVEIYREAPLFKDLRDTHKFEGRCGLCEFVGVCGGSRSRAYALTGDPLAEEPFCTYEPGSFPFQEELAARLTTPAEVGM